MEYSPTQEADRFSTSQEISPHFMEPEDSVPNSQVSAKYLYPQPVWSSP